MALSLTGRLLSRDSLLDTDLRDIAIHQTETGSYLYAATGLSGGLSVYRIDEGGGLARLADSSYFTVADLSMGGFDIVETGGSARLVLHEVGGGSLIGYAIEADGSLAEAATMDLPGSSRQTPSAVASFALGGGRAALYMVDAETGNIDGWIADHSGSITASAKLSGEASHYMLDSQAVLAVAETARGRAFLLAADSASQGLSCYAIDAKTGALERTATLGAADGLGVAAPSAIETVTHDGTTWVLLAASGSSSISVMELEADGSLRATDHIIDTLATRFDGITALEVVETDGHILVFAGGADDGLSLFSLLDDGRLVHLQSLAHEEGLGLENITGIEAIRTGDRIQIFVTSGGDAGLSQFSLDLRALGSVLRSADAAGGASAGSGAIPAIEGGAGDDILVSDAAGGELSGGGGADTFVLSPTDEVLRILDFERGIDRLDLSSFPMLRSLDQLRFEPTATGTWVRFGETEIKVVSADGKPLGPADLWPGGFDTPDRVDPSPEGDGGGDGDGGGTSGDDVLTGGGGDDRLTGGGGDDQLFGGDGHDRLLGGAGADLLEGGGGDDTLSGQVGDDRLMGRDGADLLLGGAGADELSGGGGADVLRGGTGGDWLEGNADDDRLFGDAGDDQLFGGDGNDRLVGGAGDDLLDGGDGRDVLQGKGGDDRLIGGPGADRLSGGAGDDQLLGGTGSDRLRGGGGNDRLWGGAGDDRLLGRAGQDWLQGGEGDDQLTGGGGRDRYVFAEDHGDDSITDFNPDQDRIQLDIPGLSFDNLRIEALGEDTLIDTGEGTILLQGVDAEDIGPGHFLFS